MRYKVPKFLEREIRFFNIFTFKQLILVGAGGFLLVILYYIVPKGVFIVSIFIISGVILSLTLIRIEGVSLTKFMIQVFGYFISSRNYFWQKKEKATPIGPITKIEKGEKKKKGETPLRISPKSRLGKLSSRIDMGLR
jgi:hypothetical protein